ncbi:MAG: hypothetical protein ACP5RT_01390 [Candidatus Micrarchaeia archaeon]
MQNYTPAQANATINSTISYLNKVNESGYLIFYPDLSQAYVYVNNASKLYLTSPNTAVAYALKARKIATIELEKLSSYKLISFVLSLIFTIAMFLLLYIYMKPVKTVKRAKQKTRKH